MNLVFNLTVPSKVQFYMSQGKPILAMINGDGADLINEANCGVVVNAGDSKGLAKSIIKLFEISSIELDSFGKNGKTFYERHFSKEQRLAQLQELLLNTSK